MKINKVKKAYDKYCTAKEDLISVLEEKYPIGSSILCYLNANQKRPSKMTVMNHEGDGCVRAFMVTEKGRFVRDIFFEDII